MEFWTDTAWYWEFVFNLVMFAIPTIAGVAVLGGGAATGWRVVRAFKTFWTVVRGAVDETTDPAIVFLAAKSGKPADVISKFLMDTGDQIVAMLPEEAKPQAG